MSFILRKMLQKHVKDKKNKIFIGVRFNVLTLSSFSMKIATNRKLVEKHITKKVNESAH